MAVGLYSLLRVELVIIILITTVIILFLKPPLSVPSPVQLRIYHGYVILLKGPASKLSTSDRICRQEQVLSSFFGRNPQNHTF